MERVTDVLKSSGVMTVSERQSSQTTGRYSEDERRIINAFFATIRVKWGHSKFREMYPTDEELVHAKRFWAPKILEYTEQQVHDLVTGSTLEWPDVNQILNNAEQIDIARQQLRQSKPAAEVLEDQRQFNDNALHPPDSDVTDGESFFAKMRELGVING